MHLQASRGYKMTEKYSATYNLLGSCCELAAIELLQINVIAMQCRGEFLEIIVLANE